MITINLIKLSNICNNFNKHIGRGLILSALLLTGCASTPNKQTEEPLFYPSLPNPPRIQYLTSFSSPRDLGASGAFGQFLFGADDGSQTLITKPYGVGLNNGQLLVVDTRGPGYVVFDLKQQNTYTVRGSGAGEMQKPINIVIDDDGNRYVADTGREQILVFNNEDKFIRAYGLKGQFKPTDLLLVGNKIYVVDIANHKIQVLSKEDGILLSEFGQPGSKPGEFFHPTNINLGPDGNLYISDTGNYRIQIITQDGEFVRTIGAVGSGLGQFARPKGIALDQSGHIYVVDAAFNNVQMFQPDGKLLLFFGGAGDGRGSLNLPTDIEIDYDNVALFQKYADPNFKLEFVILVTSQFGMNKVAAYGYGKMKDMNYQ